MINNKQFWSWAGKLALVAIPAAISGYTSYMKSKIEAQEKAKASYETLQKAFVEEQETDEKDDDAMLKRLVALEAEVADLRKRPYAPRPAIPTAPLVLLPPDAGMAGIGLGSPGVFGHGLGGGFRRPDGKKRADPPAKFEDAVEQYQLKK